MLSRIYPVLVAGIFFLAFIDAQFDVGLMEGSGLDIYFQAFTYEMTHYTSAQTHLAGPLTTYMTRVETSYLTTAGTKRSFSLNQLPFHFLLVPFLNDFEWRMSGPPSLQMGRYLCGALSRQVHEPLQKISVDMNAGEHLRYDLDCSL